MKRMKGNHEIDHVTSIEVNPVRDGGQKQTHKEKPGPVKSKKKGPRMLKAPGGKK